MTRRKSFRGGKDKRDGGAFISVPLSVLNSRAYLGLSSYARMLLFDLFAQYRGENNGDLCAAWKYMQPRGWRSEATLQNAKRELIASGLIVVRTMLDFVAKRGLSPFGFSGRFLYGRVSFDF